MDETKDHGKKNRKNKLKNTTDDASKKVESENMNESKESAESEPIVSTANLDYSVKEEINEVQLQKYTLLQKCSKQYEVFFQNYLASRLLNIKETTHASFPNVTIEGDSMINYFLSDDLIENSNGESLSRIEDLFATLKTNTIDRDRILQSLLNQSIGEQYIDDDDGGENSGDIKIHSNESLKTINKLTGLKLSHSLRRSVKIALQCLVTFSTIPNYDQSLSVEQEIENNLPTWLKVLTLVAAFSKSEKELQIHCISTLFELIDIVKCQKVENQTQACQHLVMIPLLRFGHIVYLQQKTRVFSVLVSTLWDFLDFEMSPEIDLTHVTVLLYRLHACLFDSGLVERVLSERIENAHLIWSSAELVDSDLENNEDKLSKYKLKRLENIKVMLNFPELSTTNCNSQLTERLSEGFKKFELLWHLGRAEQKVSFDNLLLKMLDNLALPQHTSLRTFVVKWLKEALLRGDLGRLLMPLLKIMLNPNTKRISISNVQMLNRNGIIRKNSNQQMFDETKSEVSKDIMVVENEVYAIKFGDGTVINHLESTKKKSPIASFPKKILNIAKGSSSDKMREKGLMPSTTSNLSSIIPTSSETDINNIIINPLEMQEESGYVSKSAPTSFRDRTENQNKFSIDTSSDYSTTTSADSLSDNEMSDFDNKMKLSGRTEEELQSEFKGKNKKCYDLEQNHTSYDESGTAADEYFNAKIIDEMEQSVIHDLLESALDGSDTSIDPIQKILKHERHNEETLVKRNSKTSLESAQKSDTTNNRESASEGDKQTLKTTSKQQQRKRKHLRIDKMALEKGKVNVEILKQNIDEFEGFFQPKVEKLHPFHSHLLLYISNFNTKQVLYSLESLRNLITAANSKLFICLTINTSVTDTQLKHLLIRHRKSIFGKGFEGTLTNSEFNNAYRGVMYLEVLITICLYYARSYYRINYDDHDKISHSDSDNEEGNKNYRCNANYERASSEDLLANCKIQLAAIEMLNLIFNELIQIVKDMGKGLANYVADLMTKCKVQKVILHCVLSSVHFSTTKIISTVSEKILRFNDPAYNKEKNFKNEKIHLQAIQIQLLKLLEAVIKLEHETIVQKGADSAQREPQKAVSSTITSILSQSPTRPKPITSTSGNNSKYVHNLTVSQQPMFLSAILNALQSENLKHLHKNWTELVTSSLNCYSPDALSHIVVSIMHQLCENIDNIAKQNGNVQKSDYCISQLEALTVICHFCLLDNNQQQVNLN